MKTTNIVSDTALAMAILIPAAQAQADDPAADRATTTLTGIDNDDDDGFDGSLLRLVPNQQDRGTVVFTARRHAPDLATGQRP